MVIVTVSTHFNNKSDDMTYQLSTVIIWASVEVNLVTISSTYLCRSPTLYLIVTHHRSACLPIIRPACIYMMTCANPTSSIGSQSNDYRRNYPRSQTKHSIRLGTQPRDESSSTHELTELEPTADESVASEAESDRYVCHGHSASVTLPRLSTGQSYAGAGRIMVKNETIVHVSDARPFR